MMADARRLVLGDGLSAKSRRLLTEWLVGCKTGDKRLRAGFPAGWRIGDKTGTGSRGTANDLAIVWPAGGRAPLVVAAFLTGATVSDTGREEIIAEAGRIVAAALG